MDPKPSSPSKRTAVIALLCGAVRIGLAPLLVRLSETDPTPTAFYRLLLALPLLWLWKGGEQRWHAARGKERPTRHDHIGFALTGLFFAADLALWHWSIRMTSVANATLLINVAPVFVVFLSRWVLGESVTFRLIAGIGLALSGSGLLLNATLTGGPGQWQGDALALFTAIFYAGYLLSLKRMRTRFGPGEVLARSGVWACGALGLAGWIGGESFEVLTGRGWMVLIALAVVSHVGGQGMIAFALAHLKASFSALSLMMQPVVAAALAWWWLGESLNFPQAMGGVLVLAGIALAMRDG